MRRRDTAPAGKGDDGVRGQGSRAIRGAAVAAGLILLVVSAAACGPSSTTAGGNASAASEVRIAARDNQFAPQTVRAPAGKAVTVTFVNEGKNVHEVEIKGLVKETKLQPGESKSFTVTPEKKSYEMYCEIHEDQGMTGEFVGE
jgi:plastocyanin